MSRAQETLVPWVRRMLAVQPPLVVLRLYHTKDAERLSGMLLEPLSIAPPRAESLSAESIADELIARARAHAASFGGRQSYQVTAFASERSEEAYANTAFAVMVQRTDQFDGTSEPTDMRSFGSMAARMAEGMYRQQQTSTTALVGTMTGLLERMDRRCAMADERADKLQEQVIALTGALSEVRKSGDDEEDAAMKAELFTLLAERVAPVLLPLLGQAAQRFLAPPALPPPKRRKKTPRKRPVVVRSAS